MNESNKHIQIVCVSNNLETFNQVIGSNPNMNKYPIIRFDNSAENIGISKRYNSFIENNIKQDSDFWVIFCHHDFGFNEDPWEKLHSIDKECLYGVTGVKFLYSPMKHLRRILLEKLGYYPSIKINLKGLNPFNETPVITLKKNPMTSFLVRKGGRLGQINQGQNNSVFKKSGEFLRCHKKALNLDCCCLMVHASLINKYNLRFDEKLDWHMYVEDFCINSKKNYEIQSKVVQFDCFHLGIGNLNEDFYACAKYVKDKYGLRRLQTTCIDD